MKACPASPDGIGNGGNGLFLPYHPLVQVLFQLQEFFPVSLHHFGYRDACCLGNILCNVFSIYFFFQQPFFPSFCKLFAEFNNLFFFLFHFAIANLSHSSIITFPLCFFCLAFEPFNLGFGGLYFFDEFFFFFPFCLEGIPFNSQVGQLGIEFFHFHIIILPLDGLPFNFKLPDLAFQLVQLIRHRIHFKPKLGSTFVNQVYGLVWQETVCDVPVGQFYCSNDGFVLDAHMMMGFIPVFKPSQNGNGIFNTGFLNHHFLEPSFQGLVLLKILLVFIECGGTNGPEFPPCKRGLENICSIHGPIAPSCTYECMDFIDEQQDLPIAVGHFLYNPF